MGAEYEINYYEEEGGRCRTQEFLDGLSGDCEAQADALLLRLLQHGTNLAGTRFAKPLKGKGNHLWELMAHCSKRAIRFYYWQSGPEQFTIAWGELKEGREPSQDVLNYAKQCHETWKSQRAPKEKAEKAKRSRKALRRNH